MVAGIAKRKEKNIHSYKTKKTKGRKK